MRYGGKGNRGKKQGNKDSLTTTVCRQSMLQTLTFFPQFARNGGIHVHTIYSLTDKVTAHAAALLLAPRRRKAYMARNWKREWIPRAIENVRTLWRKRYEDMGKSPQRNQINLIYRREINQLSRRLQLATNSIPLLTVIPFFSVKGRHH